MAKKSNNVVVITEEEFIECPYCKETGFIQMHWKHLKKHDKTVADLAIDFPGYPTITRKYYDDQQKIAKDGRDKFLKNKESGKTKIAHCYYDKDEDCSHETKVVPINFPNYFLCTTCSNLGKENLDGRTKPEANEAREKTIEEIYGKDIKNARQIPGVSEKIEKTYNDRGEKIGFAEPKTKQKAIATMQQEFKTDEDNIMKTDYGKNRNKKSFQDTYDVDNPMQIPEVAKKVSITLTGQPSKLKGRDYTDIHGEEKAKELIEERRISGAEGYKLSRRISIPQIKLFKLTSEIWSSCSLDYYKFNKFLDIAIAELKLDIDYDASFYHDNQGEDKTKSDELRTKMLEEKGWKVIRFIDKLPSYEELEKVVEDRVEEVYKINNNKLYAENAIEIDIIDLMKSEDVDAAYDIYVKKGGSKEIKEFLRHLCVYKKIMYNTYNNTSEDSLFKCWLEFEDNEVEAKRYELPIGENVAELVKEFDMAI